MRWHERMICRDCVQKLKTAEMTCSRKPGNDNIARCAFCGIERPCKCFRIATELKKP